MLHFLCEAVEFKFSIILLTVMCAPILNTCIF